MLEAAHDNRPLNRLLSPIRAQVNYRLTVDVVDLRLGPGDLDPVTGRVLLVAPGEGSSDGPHLGNQSQREEVGVVCVHVRVLLLDPVEGADRGGDEAWRVGLDDPALMHGHGDEAEEEPPEGDDSCHVRPLAHLVEAEEECADGVEGDGPLDAVDHVRVSCVYDQNVRAPMREMVG